MYSGKIGFNRARWLYSGKGGSTQAKVVVFAIEKLYSGNVVEFGQKWLY